MRSIDETNLRLLQLLLDDARMPVAELARRVQRSEATVRERLRTLARAGILRGYHADIDLDKLGIGATAIVRGSIDHREVPTLAKALEGIPNVVGASVVSGAGPIRIRMVARDIADLERVLQERVTPLGLDRMDTRLVFETLVPSRVPDLGAVAQRPPQGDRPALPAEAPGAVVPPIPEATR